jgi:mycothiol synthase
MLLSRTLFTVGQVGQLRMRLKSLENLPDQEVPEGLALRTFRVGDEAGWAKLMTGAIGDWDEESTARQFLGDPGVDTDGIFFLVSDDQYVATATDKRLPASDAGYLHMVAVAPLYRGRRLGRCISLAALHHMRERGCRTVVLDTDDYRLPAIRTYLAVGFVPDNVEADHADRWRRIVAELRATGPTS